MARVAIRLSPRASSNRIVGWRDSADGSGPALAVRVTAPPVDGKANAALVRLLAKRLGLARSRVRIVRGETGREKLVEVDGLDEAGIRERLRTYPDRQSS